MSILFLVDDPFGDFPKNLSLHGSRALAEEYAIQVDAKNQRLFGSRGDKATIVEVTLHTEAVPSDDGS